MSLKTITPVTHELNEERKAYTMAIECGKPNKHGHDTHGPYVNHGLVLVWGCEHYCAYCQNAHWFKSGWFVRRHINDVHVKRDLQGLFCPREVEAYKELVKWGVLRQAPDGLSWLIDEVSAETFAHAEAVVAARKAAENERKALRLAAGGVAPKRAPRKKAERKTKKTKARAGAKAPKQTEVAPPAPAQLSFPVYFDIDPSEPYISDEELEGLGLGLVTELPAPLEADVPGGEVSFEEKFGAPPAFVPDALAVDAAELAEMGFVGAAGHEFDGFEMFLEDPFGLSLGGGWEGVEGLEWVV